MKNVTALIRTTIVGGFVVILPITLIALLIAKAVAALRVVIDPLAASLPSGPVGGPVVATVIGVVVILAICFVTGMFARTALGDRARHVLEHDVLARIPGYDLVRSLSRRALGQEEGRSFAPALAAFDDAIVPAFVVEEHADGRYTVFVPAVPTPAVGAVYIMDRERVHVVDVPFSRAVRCITQWGAGSGEWLRAVRDD